MFILHLILIEKNNLSVSIACSGKQEDVAQSTEWEQKELRETLLTLFCDNNYKLYPTKNDKTKIILLKR